MSKYNWETIQKGYDSGLSFRDLQAKYGMSSRTLTLAVRKGRLRTRNKSQATLNCQRPPTVHTEEFKQQQSERILNRYAEGWMPKAGRCKKISYHSPIAGEVTLDGTWELKVAKYLDKQNLTWRRNTSRFPYIGEDGKTHHYTPDFWIEEWQSYLEVKGYETSLDRLKWSQFTNRLTVWKGDVIHTLC